MNMQSALGGALEERKRKILKDGNQRAEGMVCPRCKQKMKFIEEDEKFFYVCRNFPKHCDVTHMAYPDGRPMGKPADAVTRKLRALCHRKMDELILSKKGIDKRMAQRKIYDFLAVKMKLSAVHFGSFNHQACKQAMSILKDVTLDEVINFVDEKAKRDLEEKKRRMAARGLFYPDDE